MLQRSSDGGGSSAAGPLNFMNRRKIIFFLVYLGGLAALTSPVLASESTKHAKLSNAELKSRALTVVKAVRKLVYSYNDKDRDLETLKQNTWPREQPNENLCEINGTKRPRTRRRPRYAITGKTMRQTPPC